MSILGQINEIFSGDNANVNLICQISWYLSAALAVRANNNKASFVKGTTLVALAAWGGMMAVDVCLGNKLSLFTDETKVVYSALAWLLTSRSEVTDILNVLPVDILRKAGTELFRAGLMIEAMDQGAKVAGGDAAWPISEVYSGNFVAPFACVLLAGCGGGFIPLSNGLKGMDGWFNDWNSKSAALFGLWMQTQKGAPVPQVANLAKTALSALNVNEGNAATLFTAFLVLAPILVSLSPDVPNPLGVQASFKMPNGGGKAARTPSRRAGTSPKRR